MLLQMREARPLSKKLYRNEGQRKTPHPTEERRQGNTCLIKSTHQRGKRGTPRITGNPRRGIGFLKRRTASTSVSPTLSIESCLVARVDGNSMNIPMKISSEKQTEIEIVEEGFLDCGAGGKFIDQNYAKTKGIKLETYKEPIRVYNVDGTPNKRGTIKYYTDLKITVHGKTRKERLMVTGLGRHKIILGLPWLRETNPIIDWKKATLQWRTELGKLEMDTRKNPKTTIEEDEYLDRYWAMRETWINAKMTMATEQKAMENEQKKELSLEEMIPEKYHEFLDVFDEEKANRFPDSRSWDHEIKLKEGFEPKSFKNYNLTPAEQIEQDKFLKENLEKGYIRPSQSPMASPLFFVGKKDGKLRPCQDYRYLNEWTIKNAYPLPLISDIMDKLKGAKRFTKLNIRWGYINVRIKEGDKWKAAFKTNKGLFEPTVMFFGLCNSPATFQAMMDDIFKDMLDEGVVIDYMDDLLIPASDNETSEKVTRRVLQRLREHDLYCKPKKCEFDQPKIEYLGMIIEEGKISMDPTKLRGIRDWPIPTTVKQVRAFLGFGNFYRRFIKKFSDLARPLNNLLKKDVKFEWTEETQTAFDTLKRKFTEEPVLIMPDHTKPFQIESDASKYASGAVLTQLDSNGDRHPVSFISQTFNDAERRYEIYDRELLAIIRSLKEWRHYIQGSGHTTTVYSDHRNLTYFRTVKRLNDRQARWSLKLSEYDLQLVHIPGSKMIQSDALSRRPDLCNDDHEEGPTVMLPDEMFVNLIDLDLQERITSSNDMDGNAAEALKLLLEEAPGSMTTGLEDWKLDNSNGRRTLFYKGKNYIPRNEELRRDIVKSFHDHETAGHPGELGTYNAVRQHYWWPGLKTFIKNYVQGCAICQQFKIDRSPSKPQYIPTEGATETRPFAYCSMDLITDLPPVDETASIWATLDHGLR